MPEPAKVIAQRANPDGLEGGARILFRHDFARHRLHDGLDRSRLLTLASDGSGLHVSPEAELSGIVPRDSDALLIRNDITVSRPQSIGGGEYRVTYVDFFIIDNTEEERWASNGATAAVRRGLRRWAMCR